MVGKSGKSRNTCVCWALGSAGLPATGNRFPLPLVVGRFGPHSSVDHDKAAFLGGRSRLRPPALRRACWQSTGVEGVEGTGGVRRWRCPRRRPIAVLWITRFLRVGGFPVAYKPARRRQANMQLLKTIVPSAILAFAAVTAPSAWQQEQRASPVPAEVPAAAVPGPLLPSFGSAEWSTGGQFVTSSARATAPARSVSPASSQVTGTLHAAVGGSRRPPAVAETQDVDLSDLICNYLPGFPATVTYTPPNASSGSVPTICLGSVVCSDRMVYIVACPALDGKCPDAVTCDSATEEILDLRIRVETFSPYRDEEMVEEWRKLYGRERP